MLDFKTALSMGMAYLLCLDFLLRSSERVGLKVRAAADAHLALNCSARGPLLALKTSDLRTSQISRPDHRRQNSLV